MTKNTNYILQVLQLLAPQLEQEFPPIMEGSPLSSVEKQAKEDNIRSALFSHLGQVAASLDWLNGRISSNLISQSGQVYSYIGIFSLHN